MTFAKISLREDNENLYSTKLPLRKEANDHLLDVAARFPISKSLQILQLLLHNSDRKIVHSVEIGQADLAKKLQITRQALSLHLKRLRDSGFIQVGRGFVNVTEEGSRAVGYQRDPVIITVRVLPQKRSDAIQRIQQLPVVELFRVTGDADVVLIVEQGSLDHILEVLSLIDGVVETKSLVSFASAGRTAL